MADGGKGEKGNLVTTILVTLLLTLVGAGVGFAVGVLLKGKDAPEEQQAKAEPKPATEAESHQSPQGKEEETPVTEETEEAEPPLAALKIVPIPPVLTTLAEPKGRWIRLEGSVLVSPEAEQSAELVAEQSGERILTYLRTVRLDQIDSASGILTVRDDLDEMLKSLSNGDVRGILIHGLVVE